MTSRRRAVTAWLAATSVLIVVAIMILVGVADPAPRYPSLSDDPDDSIPGTVAYVTSDNESCLRTVLASGSDPQELGCDDQMLQSLAWAADGAILVIRFGDENRELVRLDAETGEEIEAVSFASLSKTERRETREALGHRARMERGDGASVRVRHGYEGSGEYEDSEESESVVVRHSDGKKQTILTAEGTGSRYGFETAQWSPDGEWVLVADSVGRLLIVAVEGASEARVLVDEGSGHLGGAWYIPGNKTYTVKMPK